MTELAALNVRITGDSGDLTAAVNSAKTQLGGLNTTIAQTQAKAAGMGGALGGLATRMQGAGGKIGGISMQLQDMAVQASMGTSAMIILGQQGSQVASMFGPLGAAFGAVLAVAPLLAVAFMDNAENATAFGEAMNELTAATEQFRISAQAIRLGVDKEEVAIIERMRGIIAEISELEKKRDASTGPARTNLQNKISLLQDEFASIQAILDGYRKMRNEEMALKTAKDLSKQASDQMLALMRQLANSNISGPWQTVLGAIQAAIAKAGEYARAATVYGQIGARGDPRTLGALAGQTGTFNVENFAVPDAAGGGGGGNSEAEQLKAEVDALRESLLTKEQIELESFYKRQETLRSALQQKYIVQTEYDALMEQEQARHLEAMNNLDQTRKQTMLSGFAGMFGDLSALMNTNSKKMFNIGKTAAIAEAVVSGYSAAVSAWDKGMKIGGPPLAAAFTAASLAKTGALISGIKGQQFGGGGGQTAGGGGGGAGGAAAAAPQQNVQTLNFTLTNDSFGIGQNLIRQIAAQLNESQRNGSTLIRATVS